MCQQRSRQRNRGGGLRARVASPDGRVQALQHRVVLLGGGAVHAAVEGTRDAVASACECEWQ